MVRLTLHYIWTHICIPRWVTALACGILTVPSYFRLCTNLFSTQLSWMCHFHVVRLWHCWFLHMSTFGRLTGLGIAHWSHWTFFRTMFLGRLTVLAILIKLLVRSLFHCWFHWPHMTWLGYWLHIIWFHCCPHIGMLTVLVRTQSRLTVLVIFHRFLFHLIFFL